MIEAMKQALEACERLYIPDFTQDDSPINNCITALRQAIAELEKQEPVATVDSTYESQVVWYLDHLPKDGTKLYTYPPKREWVGLTDEEIISLMKQFPDNLTRNVARAIETKLKEKNT